jgi:hypothetical protein
MRASLGDLELDYELRGNGDPIILVHHGAGRSWFDPLFEQPPSPSATKRIPSALSWITSASSART